MSNNFETPRLHKQEDIAPDEKMLLRKVRNATFPRMLVTSPEPGSVEESADMISRVLNEISASKQMKYWPVEIDRNQQLFMVRTDTDGNLQVSPEKVSLGRNPLVFLRALERFINRGPDDWGSVKDLLGHQVKQGSEEEDSSILEAEDSIRSLENIEEAARLASEILSIREQSQRSRLLTALGRRVARIFDIQIRSCEDFATLKMMKSNAIALFANGPLASISSLELADTFDGAALDLAWKKLHQIHDPGQLRLLVEDIKKFPYAMGDFLANPVVSAGVQKAEWITALKRKRSETGLDMLRAEIESLEYKQHPDMEELRKGVLDIIEKKRTTYREIWSRARTDKER